MLDPHDLTIDTLAQRAGMTVRNVRAHAARGLLPAPRLEGRTGYYGPAHLARLELIAQLQEQGFSLALIERLVRSTSTRGAEEMVSAYLRMLTPWQPEAPLDLDDADLEHRFGVHTAATRAALRSIGLLRDLENERVQVTNPGLVRAGADAVALGIPAEAVLAVHPVLSAHVEAVTEEFVRLFRTTLWDSLAAKGFCDGDLTAVRDAVAALQPVAALALLSAFREAMPRSMGEFMAQAAEQLDSDDVAAGDQHPGQSE